MTEATSAEAAEAAAVLAPPRVVLVPLLMESREPLSDSPVV